MGQVGHHSFRGDVPATMLAYGTPGEVSEYCERLITEIGMKTPGFMLGTGCEVPLNCKPENYAALMQSLPRYARLRNCSSVNRASCDVINGKPARIVSSF